jgi:hypothetical protein
MDLTLSAYRAEPPLGSPLPSSGSLSLGNLSLSRGSWAFLLGCRRFRIISIILVVFPGRGRFCFGMGDGASSAKLNHVNGTLAARDQMTARQKDNLTWRGKADETFRCRLIFRWWGCSRRVGMSGIGGRVGGLSALGG